MTHWASSKHRAQVWDRAFHQNQRGLGLVVLIQIYRRFQRSKSVPISESASIVFKGSGCPRHGLLTTIKISAPRNCGHACVEIVWLMYAVQVLPPSSLSGKSWASAGSVTARMALQFGRPFVSWRQRFRWSTCIKMFDDLGTVHQLMGKWQDNFVSLLRFAFS